MPAKISDNALVVLKGRYLKKDAEGNVIETPDEMFRRVAKNLAQADRMTRMQTYQAQRRSSIM